MAKKTDTKGFVWMAIYWAVYLTVTQVIFGTTGIVPGPNSPIPGGVIGWGIIVELPRAIVGLLIAGAIFKK